MAEPHAEEFARAQAQLLRLLKTRPRSRGEVRVRLHQKGFSSEIIRQVLEMAVTRGWLDDEKFAKLWIEDRLISKPMSRKALQHELNEKGVDREMVAKLLEDLLMDEYAMARRLAAQRLTRHARDDWEAKHRKLVAFLRRRGFSFEIIKQVLQELL
jgi:regulatory protein